MKIGICGSFGTGKTTILNHIMTQKKDYSSIISTERVLAHKLNFDFNKASLEERISFQKELISLQIELEKKLSSFVTDTSLIDIMAYCEFIKTHDLAFYENEIKKHIDEYFHHDGKYDILFYLPIEFDIENDGVRHIDHNFRMEIDALIHTHLPLFGKQIIRLEGSIEERLHTIQNIF